ncbi:MAG TPA: DinB family protein [Longimicrobiales bacterium]|nr:DinB family protein [Longimicrobiales bacterium]
MTRIPARFICTATMIAMLPALPASLRAQAAPAPAAAAADDAMRTELLMHFDMSMRKFIALAEAMPADKFTWSPGEGVMEVGHVFMHVARYNYAYPSQNMGVAAPAGIDLGSMEAVRAKEQVVRALEQSQTYVRDAVSSMTSADLAQMTQLYGRDVQRYAVLVQLVAHMNEHLGQSIAYARMNGIVPPWSR